MIRVDIIDSCPVFIHGLIHILNAEGILVLSTRTAPTDGGERPVDVSLVDPDALGSGHALAHVGEMLKFSNVLVLAGEMRDEDAADLIRAGVAGVVSRRAPAEVIIDAVRAAADWPALRRPERVSAGPAHRSTAMLSTREEQVLHQIASGLTHSQIARQLEISQHTVDTYVRRIRSKLGLGNKAELTRAAVLNDLAGG